MLPHSILNNRWSHTRAPDRSCGSIEVVLAPAEISESLRPEFWRKANIDVSVGVACVAGYSLPRRCRVARRTRHDIDRGTIVTNFMVLPPEINSLLMFTGAGSAPMLDAASSVRAPTPSIRGTSTVSDLRTRVPATSVSGMRGLATSALRTRACSTPALGTRVRSIPAAGMGTTSTPASSTRARQTPASATRVTSIPAFGMRAI
ncbi:hypothetical protein LAUMK4_00881 [Mycobacterium persicum]|uniref:PPE domain-containing protein n=1 Tax=Mycobacterium persicum TaxID=1487726 RepID=A0AB38UNU0_9MYCO|nr:hypothetical protein LAUMK15_01235 [Mycobacterium persicum]VAZ82284.1 hypothetical protein LAUMK42_01091 [Mycobacterium persicum]VAZ88817.1 hypothetical protein LAUMK4_00881 [Mycobacterium persicum]